MKIKSKVSTHCTLMSNTAKTVWA